MYYLYQQSKETTDCVCSVSHYVYTKNKLKSNKV